MPKYATEEEWWRALLTGDKPALPLRQFRSVFGRIPSSPRCKFCNAPMHGVGAPLMRLLGKKQSNLSPYLCNQCERLASKHMGGAEVELTLLFADARGSTALAEKMSPTQFSRLMNRFYAVATEVLTQTHAWVDKLVGDEVIGLYLPGFAGPEHARLAVRAAQELLSVTGHDDPDGPWLPLGVGVHTGIAFVGSVGARGQVTDVTALGDNVNITARLTSKAEPGEVLLSEITYGAAGLDLGNLEQRQLELKGKSELVDVRVLRVAPN